MYRIASDRVERYTTGWAPAPWTHAYEEGNARTVCGRLVADLHADEFPDTTFETVAWAMKCDLCRDLLLAVHHGGTPPAPPG